MYLSWGKVSFSLEQLPSVSNRGPSQGARKSESSLGFVKFPSGTLSKSLAEWNPPLSYDTVLLHWNILQSFCSQVPGRVERFPQTRSKKRVVGTTQTNGCGLNEDWQAHAKLANTPWPMDACIGSASSSIAYRFTMTFIVLEELLRNKVAKYSSLDLGRAGWRRVSLADKGQSKCSWVMGFHTGFI